VRAQTAVSHLSFGPDDLKAQAVRHAPHNSTGFTINALGSGWWHCSDGGSVSFHLCCRECLEVRCRSASIPVDGRWDGLDRRGLCRTDKIVKVKITDT
jgi:hypothetical protein